MAHWSDIQDAIVTKLQSVSSVKNVTKNWQRITEDSDFMDAFSVPTDDDSTERRVHAWLVVYVGSLPTTRGNDLTTYTIQYRYEIHGYINFMQAGDSEHLLRDIVDDVLAVLVPSKSLGLNGDATTPVIDSNVAVDSFDVSEFGPVLCSHVKLSLNATFFQGNITYS